jgi:hypothetical protein
MDINEERYAREIENVRTSTLTEEDKANRIKILEAQKAIDRERLEKKQREADAKKAKYEQVFNVFNIALSTIESIGKIKLKAAELTAASALNPFLAPLIPVVLSQIPFAIGIGAAQAAAVLARPIPKYAEGTDFHPGGAAIVGEGKYSEIVQTPSGNSFIADSAMLLDLPKGSTVTPISDRVLNDAMNREMLVMTAGLAKGSKKAEAAKQSDMTIAAAKMIIKAIKDSKPVIKPQKGVSDAQVQLRIELNRWKYGN